MRKHSSLSFRQRFQASWVFEFEMGTCRMLHSALERHLDDRGEQNASCFAYMGRTNAPQTAYPQELATHPYLQVQWPRLLNLFAQCYVSINISASKGLVKTSMPLGYGSPSAYVPVKQCNTYITIDLLSSVKLMLSSVKIMLNDGTEMVSTLHTSKSIWRQLRDSLSMHKENIKESCMNALDQSRFWPLDLRTHGDIANRIKIKVSLSTAHGWPYFLVNHTSLGAVWCRYLPASIIGVKASTTYDPPVLAICDWQRWLSCTGLFSRAG